MKRIKAALLKCAKCGWWTGFKSSKGGVIQIDTICGVCSRRLRHTERRDRNRQYINCYRRGRGAHNRTQSVSRCILSSPSSVKKDASRLNKSRQRSIALHFGVDLEKILSKSESTEKPSGELFNDDSS